MRAVPRMHARHRHAQVRGRRCGVRVSKTAAVALAAVVAACVWAATGASTQSLPFALASAAAPSDGSSQSADSPGATSSSPAAKVRYVQAPVAHARAVDLTAHVPLPSPASVWDHFAAAAGALRIHVMTFPAHGHYNPLKSIAVALARRGHNVSMVLTSASRKWYEADGLRSHGVAFIEAGTMSAAEGSRALNDLENPDAPGSFVEKAQRVLKLAAVGSVSMCRALVPVYSDEAQRPDVLVADGETPCAEALARRFGVPRVAHVGSGLRSVESSPAYLPLFNSGHGIDDIGAVQRALNAFANFGLRFFINPAVYMLLHHACDDAVGVDHHQPVAYNDAVPTLYNTHWGIEHPRPLQPYEFMVGHSGTYPWAPPDLQKPLPAELARWLGDSGDGAADGGAPSVVFVSLGTVALPDPHVTVAMWNAFQAPSFGGDGSDGGSDGREGADSPAAAAAAAIGAQRILWVARGETENILRRVGLWTNTSTLLLVSWVPQQQVLGHPNVRAFFTHGGMNSLGESVVAAVPLVCMPFFTDQLDNCMRAAERGFGVALPRRGAGVGIQQLRDALKQVLLEPSYKAAATQASLVSLSALGVETAVRVVEQTAFGLMTHDALLPVNLRLPWYAYLGLDVVALLQLAAVVSVGCCAGSCLCCARCTRAGWRRLRSGAGETEAGPTGRAATHAHAD